MRTLGNTIFLLLAALFGFGFLLAYSLNITKELTETRAQLTRIQIQYQAMVDEKNRMAEQVSGLTGENTTLQSRVEAQEAERHALTSQIETLEMQLDIIEKANPFLAWLVTTSKGRVAATLLVVPIAPLSLAAMYRMFYPKATNLPTLVNSHQRGGATIQASLTRDELHLIAQRRRSQAVSERMQGPGETVRG